MKKQLTLKQQQEYEELQKKRQILYSWSFFYSNSKNELLNTRYHKVAASNKQGEMTLHDVFVNDPWNVHYGRAIDYSQRAKDDRLKVYKVNQEIALNQLEINKYYKD